ncbi:hypothetical protein ACEE86_11790, partial [Proteus mirabilis]
MSFSLLSWLAAQTYYPQFYWQHRDESEEVAACGQVKCFNHIRDAHRFLATHRHSLHADAVLLCGFNALYTICLFSPSAAADEMTRLALRVHALRHKPTPPIRSHQTKPPQRNASDLKCKTPQGYNPPLGP